MINRIYHKIRNCYLRGQKICINVRMLIKLKFKLLKHLAFKSKDTEKKIVLVSHDSYSSGAQLLLSNISEHFKLEGWDVAVITSNSEIMNRKFKKNNFLFIVDDDKKFMEIINSLFRCGYKKAICNTVVTGKKVKLFKACGYSTISLVHELPQLITNQKLEQEAKVISEFSDTVVFPSSFVYDKFCDIAPVLVPYIIKPQGLYMNVGHIPNKKLAKETITRKYGLLNGCKIVLNVADGIERKGFDWFLEIAIASLSNKKIFFIWVGNYDKQIYSRILRKYGIDSIDNILFPGYIKDNKELLLYYDAASIFMLTSREEPFGSVILEAFNSCTPVIAFENGGGYVDTVINGKTGILVEYGNLEKMREVLESILEQGEMLSELGTDAKKSIVKYNFEDYIQTLTNLVN